MGNERVIQPGKLYKNECEYCIGNRAKGDFELGSGEKCFVLSVSGSQTHGLYYFLVLTFDGKMQTLATEYSHKLVEVVNAGTR